MSDLTNELRDEATQLERENCDVMKVDQRTQIALLRAHANALERLAELQAKWENDCKMWAAIERDFKARIAERDAEIARLKGHAEDKK